jgi:N-dimethylarginine dimethylaminohydrolase
MSPNSIESPWGADSEYSRLTDVLLCTPAHYRWMHTSQISSSTLASGVPFDPGLAARQHAEMVSAYEQAGVSCHFLEPDPALPYQVFARDSSTATPAGGVVLQMNQPWRRGEYAAVLRFYEGAGIPIVDIITAGAVEGGDVMIIEPGCVLIGYCEARTQLPGAMQLAEIFRAQGWEARIEPFPARYVHIDLLVVALAEKLAAVCTEVVSGGLLRWLKDRSFQVIDIPEPDAFALGANAMPLGDGRVLSSAGATHLNAGLRAHGIEVLAPDLSMFTLGGGGPHCLAQALRREREAGGLR